MYAIAPMVCSGQADCQADLVAAGVIKAGAGSQQSVLPGIFIYPTNRPCGGAGAAPEPAWIQAQTGCQPGRICALNGRTQPRHHGMQLQTPAQTGSTGGPNSAFAM